MKYAFWDLIEESPNYLIGPEPVIAEAGGRAEAAWTAGVVEDGADILGYVYGDFDPSDLAAWNYREITQQEALDFCLAIDPEAFLLPDGKIGIPAKI